MLSHIKSLRFSIAERVARKSYYGWVIVGVIFISNLAAFGNNSTFGLFVSPLEQEFGWSRENISRSLTLGTVVGASLAPWSGWLIDRFSLRLVMVFFGLGGSFCYVGLAFIQKIWQLNLLLGLSFALLTALLAQVFSSVAVSRWFVARRGRAMGLVMMGASGGSMTFIALDTYLIAQIGWRQTFLVHSVLTVILCVLPAYLLLIDRPEDIGLNEHRELSMPGARSDGTLVQEPLWSLRKAMATRAFWLTLGGVMVGAFAVQGYFAHAIPHLESNGFSRGMASFTWGSFFFTGVIAKFFWGFIIEKITVRWSMVFLFAWEAIGMQMLLRATTPSEAMTYAVLNGLGHGPFLQLLAMVWADTFGRRSLGAIIGAVQPAIVVAASLGPWLAGYVFDLNGNYAAFLNVGALMSFMAALVFLVNTKPRQPEASTVTAAAGV